jgi:hypothetical protein
MFRAAPPVSSGANPRTGEHPEEPAPESYNEDDFGWTDDALVRWRALALFGVLLLFESPFLWWCLTSTRTPEVSFISGCLLLLLPVLPALYLSHPEVAVTFFGAAGVGVAVSLYLGNYAIFNGESSAADVPTTLGLLGAGAVLLSLGLAGSARASHELSKEDQEEPGPSAADSIVGPL